MAKKKDELDGREILHSFWLKPMRRYSPSGIVVVKDKDGATRAYLGDGCGANVKNDEVAVACRGSEIEPKELKKILGMVDA